MPQHQSGHWWLMPPWYKERQEGDNVYFYCSGQIRGIAEHFSALQSKAIAFNNQLDPS